MVASPAYTLSSAMLAEPRITDVAMARTSTAVQPYGIARPRGEPVCTASWTAVTRAITATPAVPTASWPSATPRTSSAAPAITRPQHSTATRGLGALEEQPGGLGVGRPQRGPRLGDPGRPMQYRDEDEGRGRGQQERRTAVRQVRGGALGVQLYGVRGGGCGLLRLPETGESHVVREPLVGREYDISY